MGTKRKLPFGYKMESGRIAVDATESHWVSHLFSRYNMGVSIQELANFMNDTAVRYDLNKPWNKNMIARILADTRYLGESGFPVLVDASVFLNTEEKRKKKAPAVQKTEAQTVLRRKCGFRITPHIEHEVLYLLNCLTQDPERIVTPQIHRAHSQRLDTLKSELEELISSFWWMKTAPVRCCGRSPQKCMQTLTPESTKPSGCEGCFKRKRRAQSWMPILSQ